MFIMLLQHVNFYDIFFYTVSNKHGVLRKNALLIFPHFILEM